LDLVLEIGITQSHWQFFGVSCQVGRVPFSAFDPIGSPMLQTHACVPPNKARIAAFRAFSISLNHHFFFLAQYSGFDDVFLWSGLEEKTFFGHNCDGSTVD
jgi:hypothetical protein